MSIYKRSGSKFYWMKFFFDGELIQKSTQVSNKKDAQTIESAYRTQLALGKIGIKTKAETPSFEKAADDFLKWRKIISSEQSTYCRAFFAVEVLKRFFKTTKADKITKPDVEKFIAWRKIQTSKKTGEKVSNDTINREVVTLRSIFSKLIDGDFITKNPTDGVRRLKANDPTFHVITLKEEKLYLLAAQPILQDCFALMLETGMRTGEIYRIKRSEVYLNKNYLQITKGKTKSSVRRVYLTARAQRIIESRMNRFKGENLFPQDDIDGNPATRTLDHRHIKVVRKLGFSFRLYDSRHTFATRAIEKGIDPITLASILGHSSLKMLSRYAHPSEERKAAAINSMQNDFGKKLKAG
jgi:integrase